GAVHAQRVLEGGFEARVHRVGVPIRIFLRIAEHVQVAIATQRRQNFLWRARGPRGAGIFFRHVSPIPPKSTQSHRICCRKKPPNEGAGCALATRWSMWISRRLPRFDDRGWSDDVGW